MSDSEAMLEAIKQRRETRDRVMLQGLIPTIRVLRQTVDTWIGEEFKDLEDEILHLDDVAPSSATERIARYREDLFKIRGDQLPKALGELDELIRYIEQQKFKSSEKATEMLKEGITPIVSVAFNLSKARDRLDGMAEMIPLPPMTSR